MPSRPEAPRLAAVTRILPEEKPEAPPNLGHEYEGKIILGRPPATRLQAEVFRDERHASAECG
jgi:hypothetical protein